MVDKIEKKPLTYILLAVILCLLLFLHVFNLVEMNTDKFAFFLVSMLFVVLLIPYLRYIKVFDLVEVRKDVAVLRQDIERIKSAKK